MAENKYYGLYQGIVTNTKDPEQRGRIKVICPTVLGDKTESAWCDPLVNVAYDNGGDFCIPDKDEAVWLQFIEGDANKPVWLGGWWQKNMTPLGQNYSKADQIRVISYSDCIITMQNGVVEVTIGDGCSLKVEKQKVYIKGNLEVDGNISSTKNISGETLSIKLGVTATNVTSTGETKAGNIVSDSSVKSQSVDTTTVNAGSVEVRDNVSASGVTVSGDVSANKVSATEVTANGVSLSNHTHNFSGYSGVTETPN